MMNETEYYKTIAKVMFKNYKELKKSAFVFAGYGDSNADDATWSNIKSLFGHSERVMESILEYDAFEDDEDPYEAYKNYNEPLHIYTVHFSVDASGNFTVRAHNEEEAEEYASENIRVDDNGSSLDAYLSDDEMQEDEPEFDSYINRLEIEYIEDTGETVNED